LTLIFFGLLGVLFYVFRSIHKEHLKLQITTTKLKKANKKPTGLYFFIAIVGLFMATIGAQGFWSFYKSLRSKTTAQVIDNYSYKSGKLFVSFNWEEGRV
jgi:hypothetical protein